MGLRVVADTAGHRIEGGGVDDGVVNAFLEHLSVRNFSPATRRAYAFDLLNFLRFLDTRCIQVGAVVPTDLFDYLDWQQRPAEAKSSVVVKLSSRTGGASHPVAAGSDAHAGGHQVNPHEGDDGGQDPPTASPHPVV